MIPARNHHEWPTKNSRSDPRLAAADGWGSGGGWAGASLCLWRLAKLTVVTRGAAEVAGRNWAGTGREKGNGHVQWRTASTSCSPCFTAG